MERDGLRAVATGMRSPITGKPVFRIEDADGNRVADVHVHSTAEDALDGYRRGAARRAEAEANPKPPPPLPPEPEPDPRRPLIRRAPPSDRPDRWDEPDGFLYHVTASWNVESVLRHGLVPGSGQTFSNYAGYCRGRVFLTERGGVPFWAERVRAHLAHAHDRPPGVVVLRVPRGAVEDLRDDAVGSRDAGEPSYYVTGPVAQRLVGADEYQSLRRPPEDGPGAAPGPRP